MEKSKAVQHEKTKEKDFQTSIGNVLRYGVLTALSVAFIGGIVYLIHHGNDVVDYTVFRENDQNLFEVISSIYQGVLKIDGASLIFFGVILLFLTPVVRVLLSLYSFLLEKDYLYAGITLIVILIILWSVSLGFSH